MDPKLIVPEALHLSRIAGLLRPIVPEVRDIIFQGNNGIPGFGEMDQRKIL